MKAITPPRLTLAVLAALSVLPSCRKSEQARTSAELRELETKRIQLVHKMEVLETRLSKVEEARQGEEVVRNEWARTVEYRADLTDYAARLREEIAGQEEQLAVQRSEWVRKTRIAAVGRTFDSLTGTAGRTFKEVVITRVTDVGVEFRHATGTARLAADQLSPAQQEAFALDTAVAHEALQEESDVASAFGSWVDQGVAASAEREEARQQALLVAKNEAASSAPAPVRSSPLEAAPTSPLRAEARAFGSGGSIWYPYYRTYRTRYYYNYTYTPSRSCFSVPSRYRPSSTPSVRPTPRYPSYPTR